MTTRQALIVVNGLDEPSGTVRALQYAPLFERSGEWRATFMARRSAAWVRRSNRTYRPTAPLIVPLVHRPVTAFMKRWEDRREDEIVRLAASVDLVYLVKVPHLRLYQRLRALDKPVVVMDFNDGLWLPPFHAAGWRDLDRILETVHGVICENGHVAEYARRHNAQVHVVPDSPQVEQFDKVRSRTTRDPERVVLGWLGSPENVGSLFKIFEPLERLFERHPHLHLRVLGAERHLLPRFEAVQASCRAAYDQQSMIEESLAFDIGLFPMFHTADGRARGNLKAMIYMSAEAAAVCENYGENPALIHDGVNGALAASADEWLERLEGLVANRVERSAVAARGLATIRERFAVSIVFEQLQRAFSALHGSRSTRPAIASASAHSSW